MLTLIIVGRAGNGISSVCNTILGNESVSTSDGWNPQKNEKRANKKVAALDIEGVQEKKIAVVDTVGIGDTHLSIVKSVRNLTIAAFEAVTLCMEKERNETDDSFEFSWKHHPEMTCAQSDSLEHGNATTTSERAQLSKSNGEMQAVRSSPMPSDQHVLQGDKTLSKGAAFDAFIFVLKFGIRFTKQERDAVLIAKSIYGENIFKKWGILVFSYGDNFEYGGKVREMFMEWCRQQTGDIRELFQEVDYRCVLFDNRSNTFKKKTDKNTNDVQRKDFFTQITKLKGENLPKYNIDDFERNLSVISQHHYQKLMKQFDEFLLASSERQVFLISSMKQSIQEFKQYLMDENTEWSRVNNKSFLKSYLAYLDDRIQELKEVSKKIENKGCVLS